MHLCVFLNSDFSFGNVSARFMRYCLICMFKHEVIENM